jgi:hypothetical protein
LILILIRFGKDQDQDQDLEQEPSAGRAARAVTDRPYNCPYKFRYLDNFSITSHTHPPPMRLFKHQHSNSFWFIAKAMNGVEAVRIGKRSLPRRKQDRP